METAAITAAMIVDINGTTQVRAEMTEKSTGNNTSTGLRGLQIENFPLWLTFVVIGVFGIVGNSLVAIVLLIFTNMRQRLTNIYVINQSLVDCTASLLLLATTVYQDTSIQPGLGGELKCRLWLLKVCNDKF